MIQRNIHHAGNPPSRTCIADPTQNKHTGYWRATFERWRGESGQEHLVSVISSAPLFLTEAEADGAAGRAMDKLQLTGQFPDMTEKF